MINAAVKIRLSYSKIYIETFLTYSRTDWLAICMDVKKLIFIFFCASTPSKLAIHHYRMYRSNKVQNEAFLNDISSSFVCFNVCRI